MLINVDLPAPFSQQDVNFSTSYVEIYIAEDVDAGEGLGDAAHLEDGFRGGGFAFLRGNHYSVGYPISGLGDLHHHC